MAETSFGKYRLIAELGHGGMADVFLAVQAGPAGSGFRKLTVVKRLRQNLADEPEFVAMLVDEARIAARLNHPNVVQTNEVGELNHQYFIAMEFLDGQPLHRIQHRSTQRAKDGSPPIFPKECQYIVIMDVLSGLHHAHELLDYDGTPLQIVHRDVTPHNIFVTYEGQTKVVDFGIAKAAGRTSETRQGIIKGKVRYMAPEQAIGHNVDRRVDIFAVGVILWEIATGKRMWRDMDDLQIVQALVSGDIPRSPRAVEPSVPEGLDAICAKALAQRADDRYLTAEDFRADLEQFLSDAGLLPARRKIPAALNELFKDKRAEIRAVIERQLAELEVKESGEFAAIALPGGSTSERSLPGANSELVNGSSASISEELPSHATNGGNSQVIAAPAPSSARPMLAAFGGAILVAGILVIGAVALGFRTPGRNTVNDPLPQQPTMGQIAVRISGAPSTARVGLDDGPLHPVPFATIAPRDNKEHRIRMQADGYKSKEEFVNFTQDVVLSFELPKVDAPTAPPSASTSAQTVAHQPPQPWRPPQHTGAGHRPNQTPPTTNTAEPTAPPPTAATTATQPTPPPTAVVVAPPTTPPPQPTVDVAAEHRKQVNRTVRTHAPEVQGCYDRAKMTNPNLAGVVTVSATLNPTGAVSSARVSNSTARSPMLESCLVDRFRAWSFPPPPPGASSEISYTFKFE